MCIYKKNHKILENEHRDPIINKVRVSSKVHDCAKYKHDPLNIVVCRALARRHTTVSQCIHKISKCHWILENEHKYLKINMINQPIKANDYTKYEKDPFDIVGSWAR